VSAAEPYCPRHGSEIRPGETPGLRCDCKVNLALDQSEAIIRSIDATIQFAPRGCREAMLASKELLLFWIQKVNL
jgi:hypothetical protein